MLFFTAIEHYIHAPLLGGHNLTISEAESILGEPCTQLEKISSAKNDGHQFKTSFVANSSDKVVLYYMFDSFTNVTAASFKFDEFLQENGSLPGFENLNDLGDESFYHSDLQNFSLMIARKSNEMIRIKVNKTTVKYSKQELLKITANVLRRI
jgi:hypothetical protein